MTPNKQKIFEYLEDSEAFDNALEELKLSWCDHCEDYTSFRLHDYSKGCNGHPDTWEVPDVVAYCHECGMEVG